MADTKGVSMARRKKNKALEKLKKERWSFYKATQYRSSWRARCKANGDDLSQVPTRIEIEAWLDSQEPYNCYITSNPLDKSTLQADHIIPIARGGAYTLDNIGLTSKRYNQVKGEMSLEEFYDLLRVVANWEDKGKLLFNRLVAGGNVYRKKRRKLH